MSDTSNEICTNEDKYPTCQVYLLPYTIASSFKRIFTGDFSRPDDDVLVLSILLGIVLISWHLTYTGILYYKRKKIQVPNTDNEVRQHYRPRHFSRQRIFNRIRQRNGQNDDHGTEGTPVESPPADYRATGDCWDPDELDPDYDLNNDMIVMMLQEVNEDADDDETEEENEVVRRIITAGTDEEARAVAIENLEEISEQNEQIEQQSVSPIHIQEQVNAVQINTRPNENESS